MEFGHKLNLIHIKVYWSCWKLHGCKPVFLSTTRPSSSGYRNTSVLLCAHQITVGILSPVLATTLTKATMARKRVQDCKKSTRSSYRNDGRNWTGFYCQRKTKAKMGVVAILRAFSQNRSRLGSSGTNRWRSWRNKVWVNDKPKSTAGTV